MSIFGGTIQNLHEGLNYAALKQKAIAQNIANVDTPNYKAKTVNFSEMLADAKSSSFSAYRTDNKHFQFTQKSHALGLTTIMNSYRQNGNGVDMDKEQADLAENQIYYNALVERVSGKYNSLQSVIRGGAR